MGRRPDSRGPWQCSAPSRCMLTSGPAGGENAFGIDLGFYWFICFFELFVLLTALLHIVGKPHFIRCPSTPSRSSNVDYTPRSAWQGSLAPLCVWRGLGIATFFLGAVVVTQLCVEKLQESSCTAQFARQYMRGWYCRCVDGPR